MRRLRDDQWERIREHFPEEHIPDSRPGRKPVPTRAVLEAVLWLLNSGAQGHLLPQCYPHYKTVHRRFQQWCQREVWREVLTQLANTLRAEGTLDERESFIDATVAAAKGGGDDVGLTKRGKGLKILAIVDRHGRPLSVSTHAANHHEVTVVQLSFDFYMVEAKPEHLIGDRAYDSDGLDDDVTQNGVNLIAPHRSTRKLKTRAPLTPLPTPLARRTVLCLAPMEAAPPHSLGVLHHQLPWVRTARLHHDAPQAILR
jgi:transposase